VTGATGFIASHVVELLLRKGYRVHGTVRSKDPAKIKHLLAIQEQTGGDLQLFEADLLKELSFSEAFKDCDYVIHTVSPFVVTVKDPQRDLVDPAVNGTLAVLRACAFYPSIKRVVLTSSMASVTDSPDKELTEAMWNVKSSLKRNPYYFSKEILKFSVIIPNYNYPLFRPNLKKLHGNISKKTNLPTTSSPSSHSLYGVLFTLLLPQEPQRDCQKKRKI